MIKNNLIILNLISYYNYTSQPFNIYYNLCSYYNYIYYNLPKLCNQKL